DRRLQGRRQGHGRAAVGGFRRPLIGRCMGSPFWNFSLAVYGANAVEDECLKLQDQFGLDVNLLLLSAFLGAGHGVALTSDDISSARQEVRHWHEQIVCTPRAAISRPLNCRMRTPRRPPCNCARKSRSRNWNPNASSK